MLPVEVRSKPISPKVRFEILKRDGFSCCYCGKGAPDVALQVDHVTPLAQGGTSDPGNLLTACVPCNLGKAGVALSTQDLPPRREPAIDALEGGRRGPGRPLLAESERLKPVKYRFPTALLASIERCAAVEGITMTEVVTRAVRHDLIARGHDQPSHQSDDSPSQQT